MMKRLAALLETALVVLLSLSACGAPWGGSGDADRVTLTLMGKRTDLGKPYMTRIFEQYEEETGNRLELIAIEDSQYESEAIKRFEQGDVPDIFLHFHNADLSRFDVSGQFYFLNDQEWVEDLTDGARAYCQDRDGNLLGLPFWESSVSGCYYNKTLLEGLGLKPASTQAEFDMLCQALADIGYTPICWPADGCSWMVQFGLDPIFADDPVKLERLNANEIGYEDIPQVTDLVQWIADAADRGWFGDDYLKTGWDDISAEMGSGEAVMTFIWDTWFYTDFEEGNLYSVDDFALMPIFMNTADKGTYEGGNLNMMMVNKNGDRLEDALEFLAFCADRDNYNKAFEGISIVNCFRGQTTNIQSPMVTDAAVSIEANGRVSTAASKIAGYSADDVAEAVAALFRGETDVPGCVKRMDEKRLEEQRASRESAP